MDNNFGLDPTSDEFQAVKLEMERLERVNASQVGAALVEGRRERGERRAAKSSRRAREEKGKRRRKKRRLNSRPCSRPCLIATCREKQPFGIWYLYVFRTITMYECAPTKFSIVCSFISHPPCSLQLVIYDYIS